MMLKVLVVRWLTERGRLGTGSTATRYTGSSEALRGERERGRESS